MKSLLTTAELKLWEAGKAAETVSLFRFIF
jgi:hypothetical protein